MLEKTLKLYKAASNSPTATITRFPVVAEGELPLLITDFSYDAKRMGGAPTIQCTVMYQRCLDDEWTDYVYTEFRGERYYLKQTPSSTKDSKDARWKHECEFVSERVVLDNVYFFDMVDESSDDKKPVSSSTEFTFFGTIDEFAKRLNQSLLFAGLDYSVNVEKHRDKLKDAAIGKQVSFEDKFISEALQEIFNVYGYHYYFEGKTIYVGDSEESNIGSEENPLEYGVTKELLSIQKNNANYKPINKICGRGSDQNIPYYYPNISSKGEVMPKMSDNNPNLAVYVKDNDLFYKKINDWNYITVGQEDANVIDESITGSFSAIPLIDKDFSQEILSGSDHNKWNVELRLVTGYEDNIIYFNVVISQKFTLTSGNYLLFPSKSSYYDVNVKAVHHGDYNTVKTERDMVTYPDSVILYKDNVEVTLPHRADIYSNTDFELKEIFSFQINQARYNWFDYYLTLKLNKGLFTISNSDSSKYTVTINADNKTTVDEYVSILNEYSLDVGGEQPIFPFTITQEPIKYWKPQKNLQTNVYIESESEKRFYPALEYPRDYEEGDVINEEIGEEIIDGKVENDNYKDDNNNYYDFENPYNGTNPYEHIIDFEDIMPTIEGMINGQNQRIDMFSEFAYDLQDNNFEKEYKKDSGEDSGQLKREHPYFFGKLRKMDFNLFDHAIEGGEMTIAMTSGVCGSCKFVIHVGEETQKNLVQVNSDGSLKRDEYGNVLCNREIYVDGSWKGQDSQEPQDEQNDTINNEVWVALAKDVETFPSVMPYAQDGVLSAYRPTADENNNGWGDTFVILNIHLPQAYIDAAQDRLTKETIKYLADSNKEKFTFSIDFSRVYLAHNQGILDRLSENSKVFVKYNNKVYPQYISSYSYKMSSKDALPEIKVELSETLSTQQGALQQVINAVKADVQYTIGRSSGVSLGDLDRQYIRRDIQDTTAGNITFLAGTKYGKVNAADGTISAQMEISETNESTLTVDNLIVRKDYNILNLEQRLLSLEQQINQLTNN